MRMRVFFYLLGLTIMSFSISTIVQLHHLGTMSWDVLNLGLVKHFGFTVGTWNLIVGLIMLCITFIIDKKYITVSSFTNTIIVSSLVDFFLKIYQVELSSLMIEVTVFVLAVVVFGFGTGMYLSTRFGGGPRDSLALLICGKKGWKISTVKMCLELVALSIGILLGGPFFIGTVFASVIISFVIQFSMVVCGNFLWKKAANI